MVSITTVEYDLKEPTHEYFVGLMKI